MPFALMASDLMTQNAISEHFPEPSTAWRPFQTSSPVPQMEGRRGLRLNAVKQALTFAT